MNSTFETTAAFPEALDSVSRWQEIISTSPDDVLKVSLGLFRTAAMGTRNAELSANCRSIAAAIVKQLDLRQRVVPEPLRN
jgi:hypothetical protein